VKQQSANLMIAQALAHLPPLCTVPEAAEALRTSPRNVKRWIASGRLLAARVVRSGGSRVLIPRSSIESLITNSMA
jgi:excisionase family DNA binding protein